MGSIHGSMCSAHALIIYSMYHLGPDGTYGPPLQLVKAQSGDSPIQGCSWVDSHVDVCHKLMFYTLNELWGSVQYSLRHVVSFFIPETKCYRCPLWINVPVRWLRSEMCPHAPMSVNTRPHVEGFS